MWRKAMKQHACNGDGCSQMIERGEKYLDKAVRKPPNTHLRYCFTCADGILDRASRYHSLDGRNDFPDRYQERIASADWKSLKRELIDQRGHRCEHCARDDVSLALHHKHYRSLGQELPDDVELLCPACHDKADDARDQTHRPKYEAVQEGWIVTAEGEHWGKLEDGQTYIPLPNGRFAPVHFNRKK